MKIGDRVIIKNMPLEELKGVIGTIVDEHILDSQIAMLQGLTKWVVKFDNSEITGIFWESELEIV